MSDQITKNIVVGIEAKRCFDAWSDFEHFPEFMENIQSVHIIGGNRSHWVMEGPLGQKIEWNAEVTEYQPNERIAWTSIDGDIETSGQVTFQGLPADQTGVTLMMQYIVLAGELGEAVAELFDDPERQLMQDLRNFKDYVENR